MLGSTQWIPQVKGEDKFFGTASDYAKDYKAKYGDEPEYHNAEATAACLALVLGLEKAGSTDTQKVRDAIAGLDEESFFGPIDFNDHGQERREADVGHPDPGRQGRDRVAEGAGRERAQVAGRRLERRPVTEFLQATVYGLLQGGLLALVAVGFSLVWGVMNIVNLAHGAFVVSGVHRLAAEHRAGLDPFLGMFAAAACLFVGGYVVQSC